MKIDEIRDIENWILNWISKNSKVELKENEINANHEFRKFCLDSVDLQNLFVDLNKHIETTLEPNVYINYPTPHQLAKFIVNQKENLTTKGKQNHNLSKNLKFSFGQQQLLFLQTLYPKTTLLNIGAAIRLSGLIDVNNIKKSCIKIYKRHPVLQTTVKWEKGKSIPKLKLNYQNIFTINEKKFDNITELKQIIKECNFKPFNLQKGPLIRFFTFKFNDDLILLINAHHIILDGWSFLIIIYELLTLYNGKKLAPLQFNFYDYHLNINQSDESSLNYWLHNLKPLPANLSLPVDKPLIPDKQILIKEVYFTLDKDLGLNINNFCKAQKITPFILFFTTFEILLSRYSQQNDFIIGIPVNTRGKTRLKSLIGFLVNTLPIRVSLKNKQTIKDLLENNSNQINESVMFQNFSLNKLFDELGLNRTETLFQVAFVMQNIQARGLKKGEVQASLFWSESGQLPYNLTLEIIPQKKAEVNEYHIIFKYNANLFKNATIILYSEHFKTLLSNILTQPEAEVQKINFLTENEKNKLIKWNDTYVNAEDYKTIDILFENMAKINANKLAVVDGNMCITYQQLNEKSNQIAHYLINKKIKKNDIVAVSVISGIDAIIFFLGIIKAGAGYLYIDPSLPQTNIEKIILDSQPKIIIDNNFCFNEHEKTNPNLTISRDSLAYVIYTSGTTGESKGVMIEHQNICNSLYCYLEMDINTSKFLNLFSFSFDGSVASIWWPLLKGHTLILSGQKEFLPDLIRKEQISVLHVTPSLLAGILDISNSEHLKTVDDIVIAGENFNIDLLHKIQTFFKPNVGIWNFYGVSECAILSSFYQVNNLNIYDIPIGKPIHNTRFYVLDEKENLVPVGIAGELYIAGDSVSRGYLNNKKLTAEKFIFKFFENEERLYKTGDMVRWTVDGNLIYLGRYDKQVKIRGYRVEIQSIESVLKQSNKITDSVVNIQKIKEKSYLVAYVVTKSSVEQIRDYLEKMLPKYMIPDFIIKLEEIPLNTSGKLDYKSLPKITLTSRAQGHKAAKSIVERKMIKIWAKVLKIDKNKINISDNFFELGGDSINVMQVVYLSSKKGITIAPIDIFKYKTIENIVQNLNIKRRNKWLNLINKTILKIKRIVKS